MTQETAIENTNVDDDLRFSFCKVDGKEAVSVYLWPHTNTHRREIVIPEIYFHLPVSVVYLSQAKGVTKLTLPKTIQKIKALHGYNLADLEELEISEDNPYYWSDGKGLYSKDKKTLYAMLVRTVSTYDIAEGVVKVRREAFDECKCLTRVTIPSTVKEIGQWAFHGCTALKEMIGIENVPMVSRDDIKDTLFYQEHGELYLENKVLKKCKTTDRVYVVPEGVEEIGDRCFFDYFSLEDRRAKKELPSARIRMGGDASRDGIEEQLEEIVLPSTLKRIGDEAFREKTKLRKIVLPKGLIEIGANAFAGCDSLEYIEVEEGNPSFVSVDGILYSKSKTKLICVPANYQKSTIQVLDSVNKIVEGAFRFCTAVQNVILPERTVAVEKEAFFGCRNLQAINLEHVRYINGYAFAYCCNLQSVTLTSAVKIGERAFLKDGMLHEVFWGDDLTEIGINAFRFTEFEKAAIPNVVAEIDESAMEE